MYMYPLCVRMVKAIGPAAWNLSSETLHLCETSPQDLQKCQTVISSRTVSMESPTPYV